MTVWCKIQCSSIKLAAPVYCMPNCPIVGSQYRFPNFLKLLKMVWSRASNCGYNSAGLFNTGVPLNSILLFAAWTRWVSPLNEYLEQRDNNFSALWVWVFQHVRLICDNHLEVLLLYHISHILHKVIRYDVDKRGNSLWALYNVDTWKEWVWFRM